MLKRNWIPIGLVLLTSVCFGHVVLNDFINLDDPLYITGNPHVLGGLSRQNVTWAFGESVHRAGYWVPFTWLSLQLDASLFGTESAWGFHLTNLLFHQMNVLLFYFVLRRMTADMWRSALAAAVFALHPLRVESVAWVTERKDVLSTFFLILTVGVYHFYAEKPSLLRYGLVFLCFFIGLATKPTLVTLPFALLLLDYWPLGRLRLEQVLPASSLTQREVAWWRLVLEKVPWIITAAIFSVMTMNLASAVGAVHSHVRIGHRLVVALSGYLGYLTNTICPTSLGVVYPFHIPSTGRIALAAAVLAAITLWAIWRRRQEPAIVVGWFWFLGTMFPVSGVVQVGPQALADRYTYVPHLGLTVAIVWGLSDLVRRANLALRVQVLVCSLLLALLGALTWIQVWYWKNSETLYTHTLRVTGNDNHVVQRSLAGFWFEVGDLDRAERHIIHALEHAPNEMKHRFFYAVLLLARENHTEAANQVTSALRIDPDNPDAHYLAGFLHAKHGRFLDAQGHFQQAIAAWPTRLNHDPTLGDLKRRQAMPHFALGEIRLREAAFDVALSQFERAIALVPDLAEAHQLRGITRGRMNHWPEAEKLFLTAIELDAKDATSQAYLGFAYARQQKKDQSKRAYSDLVNRFPVWLTKTNEKANKLITMQKFRDQRTAEELATQLCEATGFQEPRWLNTLAAVQAAGGDFVKAQATARNALLLTSDAGLTRELQERIRLYERDQALPVTKDDAKRE